MTLVERKYLVAKCIKLFEKYLSHILNLDSKSKQWNLSSRALTRLSKTLSYKMMIDDENACIKLKSMYNGNI